MLFWILEVVVVKSVVFKLGVPKDDQNNHPNAQGWKEKIASRALVARMKISTGKVVRSRRRRSSKRRSPFVTAARMANRLVVLDQKLVVAVEEVAFA